MPAFWQITYGGVTKSAAAWGIGKMKRRRKSTASDVVTFSMPKVALDANPLPFVFKQPFAILRNGQPFFSGYVTKPKGRGKPNSESWEYEISGPWIILEKTAFQQQWLTTLGGESDETVTTTRSNVIIGQSLDNIQMNAGQVLMEVLRYAQYAAQLIPFPTAVDAYHLPPAPPTPGPFQIGLITPTITIPYIQVRDRSCADIIRYVLKYNPSCVAAFDYATTPPTLNIASRAQMAESLGPGGTAKTIQVFGTSLAKNGYKVSGFDPEPRDDFVPPVVVLKFEQKNTVDGVVKDNLIVQSWPPAPGGIDQGAWESQPWAWVQTIDTIGGNSTLQSANVKVIARPVNAADTVALTWALKKRPDLTATKSPPFIDVGAPLYDTANMQVAFIGTTIDPDDPLLDPNQNPNNISTAGSGMDCIELVNELVPGQWSSWLQDEPNELDCAKVTIEVQLKYNGSDPTTAARFITDPTNASNVLADGTGVLRFLYTCKVTNAETQTYSELTSWSASEPIPQGMAQSLYESLAVMSLQGSFQITERECSDMLPIGSVFNTVDGNIEWQSMNAQVLDVEEDIDSGITDITFGPPPVLDAEDMEGLFRAQLGRLPSYKLSQRTTGDLTASSNVIGATHMADTHMIDASASPVSGKPLPWAGTVKKEGGVYVLYIGTGILMNSPVQNDVIPVNNLNTALTINQGAGSTDFVYLEQPIASLAPSDDASVKSGSAGGTFDPTLVAWAASGKGYLAYDASSTRNQTFFRVLLGTIATGPAVGGVVPAPVYTACCVNNLILFNEQVAGIPDCMAYPTQTAST